MTTLLPDRAKTATNTRFRVAGALGHGALLSLLALPCALGNHAAYLALLATLLALVVGFDRRALAAALKERWVLMMAASFVVLAVAFVAGARNQRDAGYIFDFLPLLLAAPAVVMIRQMRIGNGPSYLAALALAGTAAAVIAGAVDLLLLGRDRAQGLENSPIHYADYAMILGFMALTGVISVRAWWRWVFALGPALGMVAVLMSGTRGALLVGGALGVIFVLAFWRRWIGKGRLVLGTLVGAVALVALTAVAAQALGYSRPFEVISVLGDVLQGRVSDDSTSLRLDFYRSGWMAFLDAPLFGHGWQNQITSALPYMSATTLAAYQEARWGFIHNEPLGFAVSGGVVGFFGYCLLTLAPIVAYFSTPKPRSAVQLSLILSLVAGFFLSGMTDVLLMWELPKMMFVVVTAAIVALGREEQA